RRPVHRPDRRGTRCLRAAPGTRQTALGSGDDRPRDRGRPPDRAGDDQRRDSRRVVHHAQGRRVPPGQHLRQVRPQRAPATAPPPQRLPSARFGLSQLPGRPWIGPGNEAALSGLSCGWLFPVFRADDRTPLVLPPNDHAAGHGPVPSGCWLLAWSLRIRASAIVALVYSRRRTAAGRRRAALLPGPAAMRLAIS